ncbi:MULTISPECIES: MerR family transcriptional regulator [Chelativorans]|jgi:DNA-binding transcriptional MerR regulator|uniref:Transcriptional regulator, MerR family n=1 Tax=Chelativorans sp. (strain BNC1) TaxID=266779 RepID=Q11ME6_CHESB|nr:MULTISPECIES: MerR family DNA-binding transcriptional regulator [Chelativorans]
MDADIARVTSGTPVRRTAPKQLSYIRIGELAREFDVTLRTLRFYEDKGLLRPKRKGLTRLYSEKDRERLRIILRGRKIGFPLRDMKQILDLYGSTTVSAPQVRTFLQKAKKQMDWLEQQHKEIEEAAKELSDMVRDLRNRLGHDKPAFARQVTASN